MKHIRYVVVRLEMEIETPDPPKQEEVTAEEHLRDLQHTGRARLPHGEVLAYDPEEVVEDCSYSFVSHTPNARIVETEILATLTECPTEV